MVMCFRGILLKIPKGNISVDYVVVQLCIEESLGWIQV